MIHGQKVVVVMPAYNAEGTLRQTFEEIPELVDDVLLVDDASSDQTVRLAQELGIEVEVHPANRGYGGNQKTCYRLALERGADIVVMLHPDYQYSPKLVTAMASMVASGHYDVVLGSRILGKGALAGGMPLYKYVANRGLTLVENLLLGQKLSEYHTGFRAFSREVLTTLPLEENSDDFVFDNEMLAQTVWWGFSIGEISTPARYFPEASSIGFARSVRYGFGVLRAAIAYRLARFRLARPRIFRRDGRRLAVAALLLLALLGCVGPAEVAGPADAPAAEPAAKNLVLVTVDTWRGDHFGAERAGEPLTPELDRFAERAVVFTAASSSADATAPGIAGVLTGLYPFRSGVMENEALLPPEVPTLATRLEAAGFATGGFVANPVLGIDSGFDRGFSRYELPPHQGFNKVPGKAVERAALQWLDGVGARRFFLWLHYMEPHGPYVPPPELRALFAVDGFGAPAEAPLEPAGEDRGTAGIPSYQQLYRYVYGEAEPSSDPRDYLARYAAEVRHADALLGRLLAGLEGRGLLSRTVVVVTADHGEALAGDHGHWFSHAHGLTRDQIHVPLVLYHPGVAPATVAEPVSTVDVAPTVLELLGVPVPPPEDPEAPLDGVSLLSGEPRPVVAHTTLASALVRDGVKLLFERGGGWRLHDLTADPDESRDLSAERAELRARLEAELTELRRRPPLAAPRLRPEIQDRELRRQLRALGYL